ncbi:MAG: methionyl-tRNA formyltransferase [Saprospiraceae bacterium]|nr:methionyl-tRNA formyltransferase [Saprospiraceae bacterium]
MKIVFFGTPDFAVASLKALVDHGFEVVAVVTATDKLGGRGGKQLLQSPVKTYALSQNIPVLQPANLKSEGFVDELRSFGADVQVVVAFRMLPEVVWNMPAMGTFNVHGSLLPKYRGAAPINWAIINGEKETGVTTFKLKHVIDTGDIAIQKKMEIFSDDTAGTVHDRMMELGAEAIVETLELLREDRLTFSPQQEGESCPAPKIFHEDCQINFQKDANQVHNFIRGLSPYPGAWTTFEDQEMKILKTVPYSEDLTEPAGRFVFSKKTLKISCDTGCIEVLQLKPEGKRQMEVADYLNGRR